MTTQEYRESAVCVYVPTFTLHEGHLAAIATSTDGGHSLPNIYVHENHFEQGNAFKAAAREALYSSFGEAQPTLEPLTTFIEAKSENSDIEIGYAALARLVDISSNPSLTPVPLPRIEDDTFGLTDLEIDFLRLGLEALRVHPNMTWNTHLGNPNTLPRLSRLVKNPRRFTVAELRVAFEALLYDPMQPPDQSQSPRQQIDAGNFQREIKTTPIIPLSEYRVGVGRPAGLYAMPPAILAYADE